MAKNDNYFSTITIDGEEKKLYRIEVGIYAKENRELFVTLEQRDYLVSEYASYVRESAFPQLGYGIPPPTPRDKRTVTIEHWWGIEHRMFVCPLENILFLY